MKILLLVILAGCISYLGYEYVRFRSLLIAGDGLIESAKLFAREGNDTAMLVLGDSTAVGVGASKPEDTVPGRIASLHPAWTVENYAVSGARIHDIPGQLARAERTEYELIFMQIGANDIIRFKNAADAARELAPHLEALRARGKKVVFITAGNIGATTFFPHMLRPYYHHATLRYHAAFEKLAERTGVTYVNLYTPPADDPFTKDPGLFLAEDGLHLSSEGYGLWFERVKSAL